jgi:hypothetical protein
MEQHRRPSLPMAMCLVVGLIAGWAAAAPIDLNTWSEEGPPANGNWTVSADGSSVFQSINGNPTFFVSPDNYINTTFDGKFKVETTSDDDFIGFVFGYQTPIAANGDAVNDWEFLLFSWKQTTQTSGGTALEGFALAQVDGTSPIPWAHQTSTTGYNVLASDTGSTRGWADNTEYNFTLTYAEDRIRIDIQGGSGDFATKQNIFDVAGTFPDGRFGFYNYSQQSVRYQGFTQQALADPVISPNPMDMGHLRVGDPGLEALTVENVAPAGSESLNASFGPITPDVVSATGSVTGLAPGGSNGTSMVIGIDTSSVGPKSGTAQVDLASVGLSVTPLPSETVNVSATVYQPAIASLDTPSPINLGTVHVGDVTMAALSITNNAPDSPYSENLNAFFGPLGSGLVSNSGSLNGLAPQATDVGTLQVGLDTTTAGVISADATVDFESAGTPQLAPMSLASQTVTVTGQVNNYAAPTIVHLSGSGALTQPGDFEYLLDLGSVAQGGAPLQAELGVLNDILSPADDLGGLWDLPTSVFTLTGFTPFTGLAPGDMLTALMVALGTDTAGVFTADIGLSPRSELGGDTWPLDEIVIHLTGRVRGADPIPEPTTMGLLALGGLALLRRRRRK